MKYGSIVSDKQPSVTIDILKSFIYLFIRRSGNWFFECTLKKKTTKNHSIMLRRCLNHFSYMNITKLSVFYSLSQWFGQMQLF